MKAFITFLLLTSAAAFAQTPRMDTLVSPEVHPDRRVTFRVRAPKASEVSLFGDWMMPGTQQAMTRDEQGVWSTTIGPLEPGLAIYTFTVDGVTTPDPINPRIKLRARTSASLVDVPGCPPELWEARDVPHGTVEVNWEKSKVTGDTRAYHVYTPPGYAGRSTRYPVLYLLHGNNDTASGWTEVGKASFILNNLIAEKKALPMIIVMPWGHAVPYGGSQSNNTATFERYLIEEVIPQVERKYRVARGRENRAIVGLSMGGGHALQIGLSHLELFSAVAAFSSAVPANFESRFKPLLDDPAGTNQKLKQLWIGCGRQDPAFERNQKLSELLTAHKVRNTFHSTEASTISPCGAAIWWRSPRCCSARAASPIEASEDRRRWLATGMLYNAPSHIAIARSSGANAAAHSPICGLVALDALDYSAGMKLLERITVEPGKCGGRPCIRGMRIRVTDILGMLAEGVPHEEILKDFPYLEPDDIKAALAYAARQADHAVLQPA